MRNTLSLDINPLGLFSDLIFSAAGFYILREGRKRANFLWVFFGIALMIFPYFVSNLWVEWAIGISLCGFVYYRRWG